MLDELNALQFGSVPPDDVFSLFACGAGQAVVQVVEDSDTSEHYAIKFFLSTGTLAFSLPNDVLLFILNMPSAWDRPTICWQRRHVGDAKAHVCA